MKIEDSDGRGIFKTGTSISDSKPWLSSLFSQIREILNESRSPAAHVEITASPAEIKEIWSKNQNRIPGLLSLLLHISAITALIVLSVFSNKPRLKMAADEAVLITPLSLASPTLSSHSGGGGGAKAVTPASVGVLPKAADKQLVPPTPIITDINPELIAEMTLIATHVPDPPRFDLSPIGDPRGVSGPPSAGTGKNFGIGNGDGHGDGDGNGPGAGGPGSTNLDADRNRIVSIGTGGASAPVCPVPASEPNYTDEARKGHVQGTVSLDVIVNRDGTITVSKIAQKLGYGLDDEASRFVAKSFKCKPGIYQGQPVATPVQIDVNFHLY